MHFRKLVIALSLLVASVAFAAGKEFTLVIDPGHGGNDYGAVGQLTNEKSINLAVAKRLGKKINDAYKDVKVVYTRSTDVFIPLNDRAKIANKNKGDLFVSIHVNSVDKRSKNRNTVAGAEVYTLGLHKSEENLAVAKRENAVMALESDYTETYKGFDPNSVESYIIFELSQSRHLDQSIRFAVAAENEMVNTAGRAHKGVKQAGFWVLWATGMPAVLVELDFICNPASERFLMSDSGQEKLASALFNAFAQYYEGKAPSTPPVSASKPSDADNNNADNDNADNKNAGGDDPAGSAVADNSGSNIDSISARKDRPEATDHNIGVDFRIQILAHNFEVGRDSKELRGLTDVDCYRDGGLWKYTVGHYPTFDDAKLHLPELRKRFPQAFIIKMVDGKREK